MRRSAWWLLLASSLALAGPAAAQPDDARGRPGETRIEVSLRSYGYTPQTITLEHGRPYLIHFTNTSRSGHDFTAKAFFAAAEVAPEDRRRVEDGKVGLDGGESADVHLVAPPPGAYEVHCSHFLHASFGMKGQIVVQ